MAGTHDPNAKKNQNWRNENPAPTNPEPSRAHERPMDDPGRGHGDKLEKKIPGRESQTPGRPER